MMTFFKEAFQVNRKSYPERVRSALFHAIKKTAANLDACVKVPGKDFSRKRKLPFSKGSFNSPTETVKFFDCSNGKSL